MTLIAYDTARHEDLRDVVSKIVQEQKNTILDLFLVQNQAATDTTHKWVDKKLKGYKDKLGEDLDNSETAVDVTDAANKRIITNKTYLKVNDEIMGPISGVSTNTLTVTRGALGTSAATHTTGDEVFFFEVEEEGADNSRDESQVGSKIYNFTQIFRGELKLSGTSQAVKSAGNDNAWANQAQELLKEKLQRLRVAALQGKRYADGDESLRAMGGLFHYVTNVDDEGGNALSTDMIDDKILELLDNGADANNLVMLAPGRQIKRLNALKVARVTGGGMADTSNTIRNNVDMYEFSDAVVKVVRVPEIARNELYIVDKGKIKIVPLQNRSFRVEDIGKVGDSVQKLLVGEYTTEVMNGAEAHIRLKNLAV